jgi:hypothetical protein
VDDIFTEIQEDLQREKLLNFWKSYSTYIIAAAVALVVGAAGWTYWNHHRKSALERDALSYSEALKAIQEKKTADALAKLQALSASATPTYKALADLERAALLLNEANQSQDAAANARRQEAISVYIQLAQDKKIDGKLRDSALLLSLYARLDQDDPQELRKILHPLASASHHPWHPLALELQALLDKKAGDSKQAQTLYDDLTKTRGIPYGVTQRAQVMKLRLEQN